MLKTGNGRAAMARAILSYAKADWKDHKFDRDEWVNSIKKSGLCEFEQAPVLEYNGKTYAQSYAMTTYLARKFNLMGKDDEENYQIESLLCSVEDIFSSMRYKYLPDTEKAKKEEMEKAAIEKYKMYIKKYEERYIKNGKGKYFLGDRFTLADIFIGVELPSLCDAFGQCIVPQVSPILVELITRLKENELKEFHEKYFIKTQH